MMEATQIIGSPSASIHRTIRAVSVAVVQLLTLLASALTALLVIVILQVSALTVADYFGIYPLITILVFDAAIIGTLSTLLLRRRFGSLVRTIGVKGNFPDASVPAMDVSRESFRTTHRYQDGAWAKSFGSQSSREQFGLIFMTIRRRKTSDYKNHL